MWPNQSVSFEEIKTVAIRAVSWPLPLVAFLRKLWITTLILVCPLIYCNYDFLPHLTRSAREVWRPEVLLGSAIAAICPRCNPLSLYLPLLSLSYIGPKGKELWSNLFRLSVHVCIKLGLYTESAKILVCTHQENMNLHKSFTCISTTIHMDTRRGQK